MIQKSLENIKTKLSLMEEAKEVMEFYGRGTINIEIRIAIIRRLFELKAFNNAMELMKIDISEFSKKEENFLSLISILKQNTEEIINEDVLGALICFLIDLSNICVFEYETFIICQIISSLIAFNKYWPSKEMAKAYFTLLSNLLKKSNKPEAYLNSIHILNSLDKISLNKTEFEYFRRYTKFVSEKFPKDIFCGMKPINVDLIEISHLNLDNEFVPDPSWKLFLERFDNDIKSSNYTGSIEDLDLISFMTKNDISFKIQESKIKLINKPFEGFTTKIFKMIKTYEPEPIKENLVKTTPSKKVDKVVAISNLSEVNKSKESIVEPIKKPTVFKDRFSIPYKKLKIIHKYKEIEFKDKFFEERNKNAKDRFEQASKAFQQDKMLLIQHKASIDSLLSDLNKNISIKEEKLRVAAEEKRRLEQEAIKAEEESNQWFNIRKTGIRTVVDEPLFKASGSFSQMNLDSANANNSCPNLYTPKLTTKDISFINQNIYVSPHTMHKGSRLDKSTDESNYKEDKSWERLKKEPRK